MFAKLLKHEFRTTSRSLGGLSIAALSVGVLGFIINLLSLLNRNNQSTDFLDLIFSPFLSLILISLVAYAFASALIPYIQFYKKKFTDEGYLTFTLPATTHQILLASMLNVLIWMLIAIFVVFISIILIMAPILYDELPGFSYLFNDMGVDYTFGEQIINLFLSLSISVFTFILPFVSLTIGSLVAKKRKIGAAFLIGYGIELVVSFILEIVYGIEFQMESQIMMYVCDIVLIILYAGLSVAGYFLMHHLIKKKLNI